MSIFSRFARSARGNVAIMFALTMVPVVGAVGAAIDYSRVVDVRRELADALDGGVLAVSKARLSDADALAMVRDWVDTHMAEGDATWAVDSVTEDAAGKIAATASAKVRTTIARVLGMKEVPISVKSQLPRSPARVEVAP
jgi:Flp pilus assembly protein TadG